MPGSILCGRKTFSFMVPGIEFGDLTLARQMLVLLSYSPRPVEV